MAFAQDTFRFGQLEPGESAAGTIVPTPSLSSFYLIAVAAGVTVYLITKLMDRRKR